MRFGILTLGCKVNTYESDALANNLIEKGWQYGSFRDINDIYIINTCTVTSTSDSKSRQMIRSARRKNPQAIIVAMGCYVQTHVNEVADIADIIIGTNNRLSLYDLVNSYLDTKKEISKTVAIDDICNVKLYENMRLDRLRGHTRGFIKIQDGCENFCSYCAIPFARGPVRSRHPQLVIEEINNLIVLGTKEIIIAGINTGCYGQDLKDINLAQLIEMIMTSTNLYRLRLSSIELMEVTDELLAVIKKYEKRIANHLHIPLQAGSDTVLKRMNRKYLMEDYISLIAKVRRLLPNIAITTDCLAGFVGETETEFQEAYNNIKILSFADMHIFPYSRRTGTKADEMEGHLDKNIINQRCHKLLELAREMKKNYIEKNIGQTVTIIIEKNKNSFSHGHTSNYLEVVVEGKYHDNVVLEATIVDFSNNIIHGKVERIIYE